MQNCKMHLDAGILWQSFWASSANVSGVGEDIWLTPDCGAGFEAVIGHVNARHACAHRRRANKEASAVQHRHRPLHVLPAAPDFC